MKITLFFLIIISNVIAFTSDNELKTFGFYTNEKSTNGELPIGYTLQLWKYNNTLIGVLRYNEGSFGINTSGFIDNVKYNSKKEYD